MDDKIINNLNKQLEQLDELPPISEVEMVEYDPSEFELPETIPIDGWSLQIPYSSGICISGRQGESTMLEYRFTKEVEEWCQQNLHGSYWLLGMTDTIVDRDATNIQVPLLSYWSPDCVVYFTSEVDYIYFKLRWY